MNEFLEWTRFAFRHLHAYEPLPTSLPEPTDALARLSRQHRVAGLWAAAGLAPAWKPYAYGQALYAARCTSEAERIYDCLQPIIPAIGLIKGPALALQAWPQSGLRHYDDLDFRCGKEDVDKLSAALLPLGYKPEIPDANRQSHLWHFGWGIAFVNGDGLRVEVNHRLFPPHYPAPVEFQGTGGDVWTSLPLDQRSVRTLAPAAHLLLCCMHAIWHGWERLGWVVDVAGLMVRCPGVVEQARQLAGETGFPRRALEAACQVASGLFGPLPGAAEPEAARDLDLGEAVALLMRPDGRHAGARRLQRRLCNPTEWISSTLRRLLTPGDPDFKRWSLPAGRRYHYWLLRPLRLVAAAWPPAGSFRRRLRLWRTRAPTAR